MVQSIKVENKMKTIIVVMLWDETIESLFNWLPAEEPASLVRKKLKELLEELAEKQSEEQLEEPMIQSEKTWLALCAATKKSLPAAGRLAGQQTKDYDPELLGHQWIEKDLRFRCRLRLAS